jgi:pimeloyl-ACP methyl ester carboxylesterase
MEKQVTLTHYSVNTLFINNNAYHENGIVCVFLHEALGSIQQWKSFPQLVCDRLNCAGIIIERSGHGKSAPLQGNRDIHYLHHYAAETEEVLKALFSIHQRYLLIGHSDGGSIALIMAAHAMKGIVGVISLAAHTFVEQETISGIDPTIEAYEAGKLAGLQRIHGAKTDALFNAWATTWKSDFFQKWDIRTEITQIQVPVLAIQGSNDQYGTVAQLTSLQNALNLIQIAEMACGHHPHLELPFEVISLIYPWFKSHFKYENTTN